MYVSSHSGDKYFCCEVGRIGRRDLSGEMLCFLSFGLGLILHYTAMNVLKLR